MRHENIVEVPDVRYIELVREAEGGGALPAGSMGGALQSDEPSVETERDRLRRVSFA